MRTHLHSLLLISVFLLPLASICFGEDGQTSDTKRVLYFTHEPGRFHKYTPQMNIFSEISRRAGWELTIMTGEHEAQIRRLRTPDFGKDFDVIVYNFCFASATDLEAAANLMKQTREHGVPCVLIHCSMHSWWSTFKNGTPDALGDSYKGNAKADKKLVRAWRDKHPDEPFPAWGDFTGVASTRHGPRQPIKVTRVNEDHPVTSNFPAEGYVTTNTELYNNVYVLDQVVPLIQGEQGKDKAIITWLCPQGKSKVLGMSLGHGVEDWTSKIYQQLMIDSINHLIENPGSK